MNRKDKIFSAYEKVGILSALYDSMLTNANFFAQSALNFFWGLSQEDYKKFLAQMFAGIPENFSGKLLEIPVGTGILSLPVYKKISNAEIFCVDYSDKMLSVAKNHADKINLRNINFIQGDVGNLKFADETFDLVLSIDGFHAFPEKNSAYNETFRVLKVGGIFTGCMYVVGENSRTDFFVENFCNRFGFFTPPHENIESLRERLQKIYREVKISHVKSFAGFICIK